MLAFCELFARFPLHWAIVFALNIFVAYADLISNGKLKNMKSILPLIPLFWFYLAYYLVFSLLAIGVVFELGLLDTMGYTHAIALGLLPSTLLKNRISLIGKVTDDSTLNLNPFRFIRDTLEEDIIEAVYIYRSNWTVRFHNASDFDVLEKILISLCNADTLEDYENFKEFYPEKIGRERINFLLDILLEQGLSRSEITNIVNRDMEKLSNSK